MIHAADEVRMPYMVGVFLGVNAFPDVYCVVDGPDCLFFKAEYVQGSHDLHSTLLDVTGKHRVAHTLADTNNVILDREDQIADLIARVATLDEAAMVLVTAMPMASITGSQYDRIGREVSARVGKPIVEVPAKSLQGDWFDGYLEVVHAVAAGIPLPEVPLDPNAVAVVGLFLDRTESDALGNVREVTRLLGDGLGLDVASVWPSNRPLAALAEVARAGTIVSLPHGRKAARTLAKRTGAKLVEAPLPFGLGGTAAFLAAVGEATGRRDRATAFAMAEHARALPALAAATPGLVGKRVAIVADPVFAPAWVDLARELGMEPVAVLETHHPARPVAGLPGGEAFKTTPEPWADLLIATTRGVELGLRYGLPFLEFGFPSYGTHAFATEPVLGVPGAVRLAGRAVEALSVFGDARRAGVDLARMMPGYRPQHRAAEVAG